MSLGESGYERKTKRTRKREFLDWMNLAVPWAKLVWRIAPHATAPGAKGGPPPFADETTLRIDSLQQCFNLSDLALKEGLYGTPMLRRFAALVTVNATLTAKGLLLKSGTVVHATLIAAPSSTKNSIGERDPKMHLAKNGDQWQFGLKVQIGMDADSGIVHTVTSTPVNDAAQASALVHREESDVLAVAGQGVAKREETRDIDANRHVAMCHG